jgi:hypothetical protein
MKGKGIPTGSLTEHRTRVRLLGACPRKYPFSPTIEAKVLSHQAQISSSTGKLYGSSVRLRRTDAKDPGVLRGL